MAVDKKKLPEEYYGRGRPRADFRQVINAIFYLEKTGCQWRMLPKEFPHWRTVYGWFARWRDDRTWERMHDELVESVRRKAGRTPKPTVGIIDSHSVKTTAVAGSRGYDGGKKINGRKRHIVVDTLGLIWSLAVTPANESEEGGAAPVLSMLRDKVKKLTKVYPESAYKRNHLPRFIRKTLGIQIEILRKIAKQFEVLPKRWIVERTIAWLNHDRRLSKHYEQLTTSSESMIYIGMTRRMLARLN